MGGHKSLKVTRFPHSIQGMGDHKSLTVTRFLHSDYIIHVGDPLQGYHIPYKLWEDHKSLTFARFIHSNHIAHVGDPITRFLHSI